MSATGEKQYYLKWNNFSDNIVTSLETLRGDEDFVDVTIACEGHSLKAHKVVLSACSQYIRKLLKENPCAHPIIILKDVALAELTALVSFMYNGQVLVSEDQIPQLIKTAEMLEIRGLAEITKEARRTETKMEIKDENYPTEAKRPCPSNGQHEGQPAPSAWSKEKKQERELMGESEEDDDEDDNDFCDEDDEENGDFEAQNREMQVASVIETLNNQHRMQQQLLQHEQRKAAEFGGTITDEGGGGGQTQSRVMALPSSSHRPVDIATRVSQMEDAMMPGDVLVIGETHITTARCVPSRPSKPPIGAALEFKVAEEQRLSMEMSLRLQVQRKLEAERLRAMERLRHAEAGLMNAGPMDCSTYPSMTNGGHEMNGHHHHHHHRDEGLNHHQPPPVVAAPAPPQMTAPALNLPLSPDLQLKMLMCRDFKKYTNMLLVAVFGREVLATHCLNGSKGSAKPRLDTEKVTRVIATVMEKFDVPASTVREAIRVKLNNEDKLKKRSKRTANSLI
ncbi:modifier of mdg4-like isoform X2 [Neocloeon triangulifer]|nr:modifier of mdg4-like isoform X2 [Neocloeon triangulifer]